MFIIIYFLILVLSLCISFFCFRKDKTALSCCRQENYVLWWIIKLCFYSPQNKQRYYSGNYACISFLSSESLLANIFINMVYSYRITCLMPTHWLIYGCWMVYLMFVQLPIRLILFLHTMTIKWATQINNIRYQCRK